jgi:hypothetical protein
MRRILTIASAIAAGSIAMLPHVWQFENLFRTNALDLKKYLTNRSPKRLQSLLASMAHHEYCTQKNKISWKSHRQPMVAKGLSIEYRIARIHQIDAMPPEHQLSEIDAERHRLFETLPRRIRRALARGEKIKL